MSKRRRFGLATLLVGLQGMTAMHVMDASTWFGVVSIGLGVWGYWLFVFADEMDGGTKA